MEWKESDLKHIQFLSNQIVQASFDVKGADLGSLIQALQWLVTLRDSIKLKLTEKEKPKLDKKKVKPLEPEVKE